MLTAAFRLLRWHYLHPSISLPSSFLSSFQDAPHANTPFVFPPAVFVTHGLSTLLIEWRYDGDYRRFAFMLTVPYLFCVSLVSSAASVIPIDLMFSLTRSSLRCK
jgi:hypothetical protein